MKKQYINPELKVVVIQQRIHLLSGSETLNMYNGSASEWGSRRGFDWEDDEE